jgi:hypothetical protein
MAKRGHCVLMHAFMSCESRECQVARSYGGIRVLFEIQNDLMLP